MEGRRPLHFVFKLAEREKTLQFYTDILGMKVLRHEEFKGGCAATCNGPYNGDWSKTMVGYGSEDDHFVVELTYNYGINEYELGNDFLQLKLKVKGIKEKLDAAKILYQTQPDGSINVRLPYSPNYEFNIVDEQSQGDPIEQVTLASSNIAATTRFWQGMLGMSVVDSQDQEVTLKFNAQPFTLRFLNTGKPTEHKSAEGRIAFSAPRNQLLAIQEALISAGYKLKNPLTALDTPGKATVEVVILLDPDHHEICFVGDEAYRELSKFDPQGAELLQNAIKEDKFFQKNKK